MQTKPRGPSLAATQAASLFGTNVGDETAAGRSLAAGLMLLQKLGWTWGCGCQVRFENSVRFENWGFA